MSLIYSSRPFSILHFESRKMVFSEQLPITHKFDYHGGTIPIVLPGGYLLRIARRRLRLWPFGLVHLNYALLYDENFNLRYESRPFLFSGLGFEVCNGAWLIGDQIHFAWSEDDENLLIGLVKVKSFMKCLFSDDKEMYFVRLIKVIKMLRGNRVEYSKTLLTY